MGFLRAGLPRQQRGRRPEFGPCDPDPRLFPSPPPNREQCARVGRGGLVSARPSASACSRAQRQVSAALAAGPPGASRLSVGQLGDSEWPGPFWGGSRLTDCLASFFVLSICSL